MNSKQGIGSKKTLALLLIAAALMIAALVWRVMLEKNSLSSKIVRELSAHGMNIDAASLYQHDHRSSSSIRAMMDGTDMSAAVSASVSAGFPADIDKTGEVYCILSQLENGVLTLFIVDETIELAFIQLPGSDEVRPIG